MPIRLTCFSCRTAFDAPAGAVGLLCHCPICGSPVANAEPEPSVATAAGSVRLGKLAGTMREVRRDRRRPFRAIAIAVVCIAMILGCVFLLEASVNRFTRSSLASGPPVFARAIAKPDTGDIFAAVPSSQPSGSLAPDQNRTTPRLSAIAPVPDTVSPPPPGTDPEAARAEADRTEKDRLAKEEAQKAIKEQAKLKADQFRIEQGMRKRAEAEQKKIRDDARKREKEAQQREKAAAQAEKQRQKEVDRKIRDLTRRQDQQEKEKQQKLQKMLKQEVPDGSDPGQ